MILDDGTLTRVSLFTECGSMTGISSHPHFASLETDRWCDNIHTGCRGNKLQLHRETWKDKIKFKLASEKWLNEVRSGHYGFTDQIDISAYISKTSRWYARVRKGT